MGFSRQEDWSGLPFPSPGDLPDSGIEPGSPTFQADTLTSEPPGKPLKLQRTSQNTQAAQARMPGTKALGPLTWIDRAPPDTKVQLI